MDINHESAAIRPSDGSQEFVAVMAWRGIMRPPLPGKKASPTMLAYKCKDAHPIVISNFVKTFIYFCPVTKTHDIHEVSTGVRIAGGGSIADAVKKAIDFFKNSDEKFFFEQCRIMGPHSRHTIIEFDTAMDYLRQGEEENKRAAAARMFYEHRKPKP